MALVVAQLASPELLGIIQGIQMSETAETLLPELEVSLNGKIANAREFLATINCVKLKNKRS